jgi:hypothetical protein
LKNRSQVSFHAARLQRRRHVEHDDVLCMTGENGGEVVPADRGGPGFDEGSDFSFGLAAALRHDCAPDCWLKGYPLGRTPGRESDRSKPQNAKARREAGHDMLKAL